MLTRRDFLASSLALGAYPLVGRAQNASSNAVFRHGVASGDPLTDRVILWTRVTPATREAGSIEVEWSVARNPDMSRVVGRGSTLTARERDYTVKIDASELEPGTTYYYRFTARGEESPIGRTRTIATGPANRARFALTSCANLPFGYFNVYARIAELPDLDAVIHLGDYIYEYANANYGNRPGVGDGTKLGRVPRPNREILQLNDYRARYAQYREDADLQEVHRQHPFIVIWDDHEFANNAWRDGAGNHNAGEGAWTARRRAAEQAWREWMPARMTTTEVRGYRQFTFGGLADLFMLDTRVTGRDQAASPNDVVSLERASRQLLGTTQEQWLFGGLRDSVREKRPWQILGQQVMFAPQVPDMQRAVHTDTWDGYRGARGRVFDAVASAGVSHLVVFTGDVHSSWAYDLARDPFNPATYDPHTGRGVMGTEIIAPAVTSPTSITPDRLAGIRASRPHLKFLEVEHRGYTVVDVTRERLQADWWFVPTIAERTTAQTRAKTLVTEAAMPRLVEVG
jgi:alkaline phosphatase D